MTEIKNPAFNYNKFGHSIQATNKLIKELQNTSTKNYVMQKPFK